MDELLVYVYLRWIHNRGAGRLWTWLAVGIVTLTVLGVAIWLHYPWWMIVWTLLMPLSLYFLFDLVVERFSIYSLT